ncbi:ABC-type cobalamin/Fe3+-siderophores transport system ATPase subunit [Paenibacillus sp. DS2015]
MMIPTHIFQAEQLVAGYENKTVIHGVDLIVPSNKISVIIGSNGCGKSTLLKTLARLIKPTSGKVTLDGRPIGKIPAKQLARVIGLLPQSPIVPEGISVADLVGRGRFPHQSLLSGWTKKDYEAVAEAMTIMNITEFANHNIDELSGGQRQRVWIAMALAQQTDILFLDEPKTRNYDFNGST